MAKRKSQKLHEYDAKRDFTQSPEPTSKRKSQRQSKKQLQFVVQQHDATRLHFDLRLEMEGALTSFAVPKGLSFNPKDKHLAIQTEDHPLEYLDFHGVIPAGQYGAGVMTIWDRGTYQVLEPATGPDGIRDGKLVVALDGMRFRGQWHLVKLKGSEKDWLIIKGKDRYSRGSEENAFDLDLSQTPRTVLLKKVEPLIAKRTRKTNDKVIAGPMQWLFEPNFVGKRAIARVSGGEHCKFVDRDSQPIEKPLAELCEQLEKLRAENAVLDGVLVAVDEDSRPSTAILKAALDGKKDAPIWFYVFDLLYYEAWDLRSFPLHQRKAALASILPKLKNIVFVDHERFRAADLFNATVAAGLPGVIAKRATSTYDPSHREDWIEITPQTAKQSRVLLGEVAKPIPAKVSLTNRHKILWPRQGFTKGDLIDYYDCVSEALLPHLKRRPLSIHRFPNGIDGESFFQKNVPDAAPDWIRCVPIESDDAAVQYFICEDRETLLYLANLASVELHPWLSQIGSLDSPDVAVWDLDPIGVEFHDIVRVAQTVHSVLDSAGLRPLVKTSGSKGLHVYLPLEVGYSYDQVRMFCEAVARLVVDRQKNLATIERSKGQRVGKIYVDYLQNRKGQTVVAPYVIRPVTAGSISAPLAWDELGTALDPAQFTLQSMPGRLDEVGDLFSPVLEDRQSLGDAIEAIREMAE